MPKHKGLWDIYRFAGYYPKHMVCRIFGDPKARTIQLRRRGKKQFVEPVARFTIPSTTERPAGFETCTAEICGFTWKWRSAESCVAGVRK
jgi:hypothetical protein